MYFDRSHVRHLSDGKLTNSVSNVKKINHGADFSGLGRDVSFGKLFVRLQKKLIVKKGSSQVQEQNSFQWIILGFLNNNNCNSF